MASCGKPLIPQNPAAKLALAGSLSDDEDLVVKPTPPRIRNLSPSSTTAAITSILHGGIASSTIQKSSVQPHCFHKESSTSDYGSGDDGDSSLPAGSPPVHPGELLALTLEERQYEKSRVFHMSTPDPTKPPKYRVYKLVLTGGPCGGKTTGQDRLATFFEQLGWKVFTVPEAATILLGGGVKFGELSKEQAYEFQKDLLRTLLQLESVYFNQASLIKDKNVLVICDRGAMDPSAYLDADGWDKILKDCALEMFELRENRYNQVVHMVTAADGAENYYTQANNATRSEGIAQAVNQDTHTRNAWVGHPYVDIVDNADCTKFDDKMLKLLQVVCDRVGVNYQDRLSKNSKKRKWLISGFDESKFPKYEEFSVTHDYLLADKPDLQVRIRERCQNNRSTFTITTRCFMRPETVETRMQITEREYNRYLSMKDSSRATLHKKRRCFNYGNQYFHLDIYVDPLPPACQGHPLIILETYTTKPYGDKAPELPDFVEVVREVTKNEHFSMYKLAKVGAEPLTF
uniref:AAA_28 domain-containing protein n=1 Tax=Panagrellus redivivus TaxID=6233 RepID=A0A7E4UXS9_PANRE